MITKLEALLKKEEANKKNKEKQSEITEDSVKNFYFPEIINSIKKHGLENKKIYLYSDEKDSYYNDRISYYVALEFVPIKRSEKSFYGCPCSGAQDGSEHLHLYKDYDLLNLKDIKYINSRNYRHDDADTIKEIIEFLFKKMNESPALKYDLEELKDYIEKNFVSKENLKRLS